MASVKEVLLVDDEPSIRFILSKELAHHGVNVRTAEDVPAARSALAEFTPDVVVLDLNLPGVDGATFLHELRSLPEAPPVVILTGHAHVDIAVQCMKEGAADLLTKPCSVKQLLLAMENALERDRLQDTARTLLAAVSPARRVGGNRLIGKSAAMQAVRRMIERVAPTEEPVLIVGESGIGKELVAQELQSLSARAKEPFLTVNCAAVTDTLLESELFGHEKGAFSGAVDRRLGYFELANGGTIFLDEIGDMPLTMQAKLLRVLQSGEVRRVGGSKTINVNVRVIAATNKPLAEEIGAGNFREDLFHRINTIVIEVPPLRDRLDDLEVLCKLFLQEMVPSPQDRPAFSEDAIAAMHRYEWPGNVRELRNVVRRAVILREGSQIEIDSLPSHIVRRGRGTIPSDAASPGPPMARPDHEDSASPRAEAVAPTAPAPAETSLALDEVERRHILAVLKANGGSKAAAARSLGISVRTLYNKFEAWGINDQPTDQ
jgi:two-component system response regulator AtoC